MELSGTVWPDLKCCQHCDRNTNILCFSVPPVCPICCQDTNTTPMRIPPYVLPTPFVNSSHVPCSIVLRPTLGDFIRHYTNTADLHIGVTDSSGCCYDFDEEGLHMGSMWQQCLAIPILTQTDQMEGQAAKSRWDHCVNMFVDPRVWTVHRYHEKDCNCFDFVLQFLRFAGLSGMLGDRLVSSKQVFCEEFLEQRTARAACYVSLYRKVLKEGFVMDTVKS